jgi:hypothetical protein
MLTLLTDSYGFTSTPFTQALPSRDLYQPAACARSRAASPLPCKSAWPCTIQPKGSLTRSTISAGAPGCSVRPTSSASCWTWKDTSSEALFYFLAPNRRPSEAFSWAMFPPFNLAHQASISLAGNK